MRRSVLRNTFPDDTWVWIVAFGVAVAGTVAAVTYLVALLLKLVFQGSFSHDGMIDGSMFHVPWPVFAGTAGLTLYVVVWAWVMNRVGKHRFTVPELMSRVGASLVTSDGGDVRLQRLLNINEELALASGLPTPAIYVLGDGSSINAFTAGTTPEDTAICVTDGALLTLKRAELQAVMAHEYGHIETGDVWRNTKMLFVLEAMVPEDYRREPSWYLGFLRGAGLLVLFMLGVTIITFGKGALGLGITLIVVVLGIIIATIAKGVNLFWLLGAAITHAAMAAASRTREFVADDSSARYTRDPEALASSLRKIAGLGATRLDSENAGAVAHMCIAPAVAGHESGIFAAHPTLENRLRQLGFPLAREEREQLDANRATALERYTQEVDYELNIVQVASPAATDDAPASQPVPTDAALTARPDLVASATLSGTFRDELRRMLRTPTGACAAAEALIRDASGLDPATEPTLVDTCRALLARFGPSARLPLLQLAAPGLRSCAREIQQSLVWKLRGLMLDDDTMSLREMVFFILVRRLLVDQKTDPAITDTSEAYAYVLGVAARAFTQDEAAARAAFELGRDACFARATKLPPDLRGDFRLLEDALVTLATVSDERRRAARAGLARALSHDGRISLEELEFLRSVSAAMALPLPPIALPAATRSA